MNNRIRDLRTEKSWSQAELAEKLGVSRQTVIGIESGRTEPGLPLALRIAWVFNKPIEEIFLAELEDKMNVLKATWQYQDRFATALDEVDILARMGREGWEMVGFGPGYLRFRRPEDEHLREPWEYHRISGVLHAPIRTQLEADGWVYCGSWLGVFQYFKRPLGLDVN
ncbi:MAG: helix-turn-helix transcriptional regulator [Bryobacteraceae bacterium]|jgi:putative transcriptional regulator